ncbi:MAG: DUF4331 family protein [Hyphomicrobium sp.]|nr:DUF4331 family protein [Hyphomicrobium sp.]
MGHHFDSPESRADSRINITDNYLFHADQLGSVVAVMAVSPLAGLPSPFTGTPQWRTFRPGCSYDFRFDNDGDARVDRILRLVFAGDDLPQTWEAHWLEGDDDRDHHGTGQPLGRGMVGETVSLPGLGRLWVGEAGDPFWLDAVAAKSFIDGLVAGQPWMPDKFSAGLATTGATNVLAIVAEVPLERLGSRRLGMFTTVSANDHGHWTQVQRCGRPNLAATFLDDPKTSLKYNGSDPDTDLENFGHLVASTVAQLVSLSGTAADPAGYGQLVARALLPDIIPFDADLAASFGFAGINGRGLGDDFGAVVYSAVFNHPMRTALAPLPDLRSVWPYVPPPRPLPSGPGIAVPPRNS